MATESEIRPSLNLVSVFEAEATRLITAADEGRILHGADNIRDSGEPVERAFRELFERRLPDTFRVVEGYFHGEKASCSPQIDFMVAQAANVHSLGPTGHERRYIPYNAVNVMGEIKNSYKNGQHAFSQIAERVDAWVSLNKETTEILPPPWQHTYRPISFILFAKSDSANIKSVQDFYRNERSKPVYAIFLDRACMIASQSNLFNFKEDVLSFYDHRNAGEWSIFKAEKINMARGHILLWLYFTISAHLNWCIGNKTPYVSFTRVIELTYRMKKYCSLEVASELPDL